MKRAGFEGEVRESSFGQTECERLVGHTDELSSKRLGRGSGVQERCFGAESLGENCAGRRLKKQRVEKLAARVEPEGWI